MIRSVAFFIFVCLIFSGCGYHIGQVNRFSSEMPTLEIPYVQGDLNGELTAAIIQAVIESGSYDYRSYGASFILKVIEMNVQQLDIGFKYDRKKSGQLTKDTIPVEERITMTVEISLIEAASSKIVLGPIFISANIDYDHDYYFSRNGINIKSLGQLTDLEEAYDAVQRPLNRKIGLKIAECIQ